MTPSSEIITQAEKGRRFRALHERKSAFIIPNPYDVGTALLLAHLGFEALATTSAGYAFSVGLPDSAAAITRDALLENARSIAAAECTAQPSRSWGRPVIRW